MLVNNTVKRVFAFGCSFTNYFWSTWAEIVALDLNADLYNYGRSGAGNTFIANTVAQADAVYKFNKDDLVIVSWTNVCREDRWRGQGWVTPGNIFTQVQYDQDYVKNWADPVGYMVRDLGQIHLTKGLLEKTNCNFHMFQMVKLLEQIDPKGKRNAITNPHQKRLSEMYKETLDFIKPSFFSVLWNDDIYNNKMLKDKKFYNGNFADGHPTPLEHLEYLKAIFPEHTIKSSTIDAVTKVEESLQSFIKSKATKPFTMYQLSDIELEELKSKTRLKHNSSFHRV